MSLRRWIAAAIAAVAGVAVLGAWLWTLRSREPALERDWTAVAFVLAGDGRAGNRDGPAATARFSDPFGVAVAPDGTVFVADAGAAQSIRRISPDGIVSTFATGFNTPSGLAVDGGGVLYVADTGNNAIRRVDRNGTVSTVAGGFNGPIGVAVDAAGRVIVADTYNDRIRAIEPDGTVVTITDEYFDTPCGVAVDAGGNIYVAETGAGVLRVISPAGVVSTIEPMPFDGLFRPIGIAVGQGGVVYATDDRGRIVEIRPGAGARTLIGSRGGFGDGFGAAALLRGPAGVAIAGEARLIVTEPRNAIVRLVTAPSQAALRPPAGPDIAPEFDAARFASEPLLWPLAPLDGPFEITGTLGEPRGGDGERFHAGIDVHAPEGTSVRAVRSGVVPDPVSANGFGGLNESVRIGPLTYVHIRVGRDNRDEVVDVERFVPTYDEAGRLAHLRVKRGARFSAGEIIGSANAFNHVHLNVGWPGEEHNPLRFRLTQFEDTVPPTIARGGVRLFSDDGQPMTQRKRGRLVVDRPVRIVVDAWDQVNGNKPRRRLGLYRLGYQVLNRDGTGAPGFESPRETQIFDRISSDSDAPRVVYATGSGIPYYGGRSTRFLYVVTSTLRFGAATEGTWDPATLPPGDYTLRIFAADINGNVATANRDVRITIGAASDR
jgi:sugar lactone lactonase YvrE